MKIAARQAFVLLSTSASLLSSACGSCGGGGPGGDRADSRLSIVPEALDFGNVVVSFAARVPLTLGNVGRAELVISSARPSDNLASELSIDAVPARIEPGETSKVTVSFSPKSHGTRDGEIAFETNSLESPTTRLRVLATAIEPKLIAEPPAIDFGRVVIGQAATATVSIENVGDVPIMIAGVTPDVGTSPAFASALAGSRTLRPGEAFVLQISYSPEHTIVDSGRIVISDDTHAPMRLGIDVRGEGVPAEIEVVPSVIDFEGILVGERQVRSLLIRNLGTRAHTITSIGLTTTSSQGFSVDTSGGSTPPFSIPPGLSHEIAVMFEPADAARHTALLAIRSSGLMSAANVSLIGQAGFRPKPALAVFPASLTFGQVQISSSSPRRLSITNAGQADLHLVGDIAIDPPTAPFSLVDLPPVNATFPPEAGRTISVVFSPPPAGGPRFAAGVVVRSDDPSFPILRVPIGGEASADPIAHLDFAPALLSFASVPFGAIDARSIGLISVGSLPLVVSSAELIDDAGGRLRIADATRPTLSIAPLETSKLSVELRTSTGASGHGQLRFLTNDLDRSSIDIPIEFSAVPPPIVAPAISVKLAWDGTSDLDLHLVREGGGFFDGSSDACWCSPSPEWTLAGLAYSDPIVERDLVRGSSVSVERVRLAVSFERYQVIVHDYSDRGTGSLATATVTASLNGVRAGTYVRDLADGLRWDVGTIDAAAGTFTPIVAPLSSAARAMCY